VGAYDHLLSVPPEAWVGGGLKNKKRLGTRADEMQQEFNQPVIHSYKDWLYFKNLTEFFVLI
jgi:hypothetical protein